MISATVNGEKRTTRNTTLYEFAELMQELAKKFPEKMTVDELFNKIWVDLEKSGEIDKVDILMLLLKE